MGVGGGFIMVPAMIYLLARADQRRGRHLAVPDRVPDRGDHGAACLAEPDRRRRAGGAADGGRRDRRAVRGRGGGAAEGGAAALPAGGAGADGRPALRLAADRAARASSIPSALRSEAPDARALGAGVRLLAVMAALGIGLLALGRVRDRRPSAAAAQAPPPVAKEAPHSQVEEVKREQQPGARESVQADVSARNVAVTSSFNGTEIVIFGAVDNSQQPSAEFGLLRRDDRGGGRARPHRRAAQEQRGRPLAQHLLGHLRRRCRATTPSPRRARSTRSRPRSSAPARRRLPASRFTPAFGQTPGALHRGPQGVPRRRSCASSRRRASTSQDNYGVAFIGRSLFRATIELPANVHRRAVRHARLPVPRGEAAEPVHGAPQPGARGARAAPARLRLRLSDAATAS